MRLQGTRFTAGAVIAGAVMVVAIQGAAWYSSAQAASATSSAAVAPPPPGTLNWPISDAEVTQGFGPSPYSIEPALGAYPHFHSGIDLRGPPGALVLAAAGGVVTEVIVSVETGPRGGYGTYVVVSHGRGLTTLYGHLASTLVRKGRSVRQGQAIGRQGSTGNSTGPHLHFEVRVNGAPVDPALCLPPTGRGQLAAK